MTLKQQAVSGVIWSFIDQFSSKGISFIVGLILARLLTPREFGLIGMITVFIAVSQSFINSGFSSALIRKKRCTVADFSTVFYYNLAIGIVFFFALFFSSSAIGIFFEEPVLKPVLQLLGFVVIIDSFALIQRTILTKKIDFKLQARISIIASLGSGVIAVIMAYRDYGVWSLVILQLSRQTLNSLLLWLWSKWKPSFVFCTQSFKELFGFGSKLLISGLIDTIYRNIYYFIIGKFFFAEQLGYYTRADQFKNLPSQNLTGIIGRVTYPVLAGIQDDTIRLKKSYRKLIRITMFVTFILMLGMASVAEPMILTLIGKKWHPAVLYLQMLTFVGMMYPLHALNLNMLQIQGRSDLILRLEIIKKILALPTIIIGITWGIKLMITGMIINSMIAFFLNSYWSGRLIFYSSKQQIFDVLPSFILALVMASVVFFLGYILPFKPIITLLIQTTAGTAFIILTCELLKFKEYLMIKNLIHEKISELKG